jgi:hypothetical protein
MTRESMAHPILDRYGVPIPPHDPWPEFDMEDPKWGDGVLFAVIALTIVFLVLTS